MKVTRAAIVEAAEIHGYNVVGNVGAFSVMNNGWEVMTWGPCIGINLPSNIKTVERLQTIMNFMQTVLRYEYKRHDLIR